MNNLTIYYDDHYIYAGDFNDISLKTSDVTLVDDINIEINQPEDGNDDYY